MKKTTFSILFILLSILTFAQDLTNSYWKISTDTITPLDNGFAIIHITSESTYRILNKNFFSGEINNEKILFPTKKDTLDIEIISDFSLMLIGNGKKFYGKKLDEKEIQETRYFSYPILYVNLPQSDLSLQSKSDLTNIAGDKRAIRRFSISRFRSSKPFGLADETYLQGEMSSFIFNICTFTNNCGVVTFNKETNEEKLKDYIFGSYDVREFYAVISFDQFTPIVDIEITLREFSKLSFVKGVFIELELKNESFETGYLEFNKNNKIDTNEYLYFKDWCEAKLPFQAKPSHGFMIIDDDTEIDELK